MRLIVKGITTLAAHLPNRSRIRSSGILAHPPRSFVLGMLFGALIVFLLGLIVFHISSTLIAAVPMENTDTTFDSTSAHLSNSVLSSWPGRCPGLDATSGWKSYEGTMDEVRYSLRYPTRLAANALPSEFVYFREPGSFKNRLSILWSRKPKEFTWPVWAGENSRISIQYDGYLLEVQKVEAGQSETYITTFAADPSGAMTEYHALIPTERVADEEKGELLGLFLVADVSDSGLTHDEFLKSACSVKLTQP